MTQYEPYKGPGKDEIWESEFIPAKDAYNDELQTFSWDEDMSVLEEVKLAAAS